MDKKFYTINNFMQDLNRKFKESSDNRTFAWKVISKGVKKEMKCQFGEFKKFLKKDLLNDVLPDIAIAQQSEDNILTFLDGLYVILLKIERNSLPAREKPSKRGGKNSLAQQLKRSENKLKRMREEDIGSDDESFVMESKKRLAIDLKKRDYDRNTKMDDLLYYLNSLEDSEVEKREDIQVLKETLRSNKSNLDKVNEIFGLINRSIFNGNLISIRNKCEIKLMDELFDKHDHGAYSLTRPQFTSEGEHLVLIELFNKINNYDFINVLIHECIHAFLFFIHFDKEQDDNHSEHFVNLMNKINSKFSTNVKIFE